MDLSHSLSPVSFPTIYRNVLVQGRSQYLAGGGEICFSDLDICMSRSDMLPMAKPGALLEGFGGMPPPDIFFKWGNLVSFGVYLVQILSLKNSKITCFI